ncbi:hypothetical protein SDC9_142880 [bioreactor metagenome]|uniref:PD-(D/E)XK endonuclease-like domain-containing protein n=1 Tax=bioreactor metagenome TaxID=1076179 RepID=A0A645E2H1_9ZZZZ|nr:PD-(D/E)XK nuclease family protein [Cloacibacillus evryensis]MEA5034209.1 PD-(D/E)XK nuclease family protein [Cloacibacillus evryensis]
MELTASKLRCFKTCPRKYYFEYIELLKPLERQEALVTGSNYHECLEHLLSTGSCPPVTDLPSAMCEAFNKYISWRNWEVKDVEQEYKVRLAPGVSLKGKIDALCADGTPIEHKSSSTKPDEKYRTRLFLDDQVTCYLLALSIMRGEPVTKIIYTVCAKPKLKGEGEELLARQRAWFDEDKVQSFMVVRAAQELEDFQNELIYMGRKLQQSSRTRWYRNPQACSIMPCAYQSICQDYDPYCLVGFTKKERESEELENN